MRPYLTPGVQRGRIMECGRRCGTGRWLVVLILVPLLTGLPPGPLPAHGAAAQEEVPPAGPPVPLSQRLRAQGHPVDTAEAAYLDADEQAREEFLRLQVVVDLLASLRPDTDDWKITLLQHLGQLAALDPTRTPVAPPPTLLAVHDQSLAYRRHLGAAALQWLAGVHANDPTWLQRGAEEHANAERARLAWYKALWEHYTGQPAPAP